MLLFALLQHDCQEFLALLLDSLHEHLNSLSAETGTRKLTVGDHNQSFSQSESSDVDAEVDDVACAENNPQCSENSLLINAPSTPDESLESFLSRNEQLLLDDVEMEDSSRFVDGDSSSMQSSNCMALDSAVTQQCTDGTADVCSAAVDENGRKVPSIEDFSKDTKTLNTNVLIAETAEELAMDSEKFHKMENTAEHGVASASESLDDEVTSSDQLHELLLASCDGSVSKPFKETNLLVNCREKFVDSVKTHSVAAYALTSATDVDCFLSSMKQFCSKPVGGGQWTTEPDDYVENYDNINNIKRVKIDDQAEKNLRMQAKLKVNTEQNQTRLSSLPIADCTATNAIPADQLIANSSSSPVVNSAAGSQSLQSSALSCSGDVIAARHVRRAEEAWRAYTSQNRSVIVDTFQGQFKSTVSNFASPDFFMSVLC